jgi:hypothetical protein
MAESAFAALPASQAVRKDPTQISFLNGTAPQPFFEEIVKCHLDTPI